MRYEAVCVNDCCALLDIYSYYVENTAVSLEHKTPSEEEFAERIRRISSKYPYIKAVDECGIIVGYAYASTFKPRASYDWSVETTVYINRAFRHRGIGSELYSKLEKSLIDMGILNMNACIATPIGVDEYLTDDSLKFHRKSGFLSVGVFNKCAYKFGHWYDMTWMEKSLGLHTQNIEAPKFGEWRIL